MRSPSSVFDEAEVVFPHGNGSSSASDRLKICVWNPSDHFNGREKGCAHTVATSYVPCAAFGHECRVCADFVGKYDGVVVVRSFRRRDDLHAVVERLAEPHCSYVVSRNGYEKRNIVLRTYLCECAGGVSG